MRNAIAALACLATLATSGAQAASITWGTPTAETGSLSDFVTTGSLFSAVSANTTKTVGDITFYGRSSSATAANVTFLDGGKIQGLNFAMPFYPDSHSAPGGWDSSYASLVSGNTAVPYSSGSSLLISGLSTGAQYLLQIFMPFWDANWKMSFSDGTNATSYLNVGSPDTWAGPGAATPDYVTGVFTADASTQTIYLGNNLPGQVFHAMQVRTLSASETAVPEPASALVLLSSLALVGAAKRRRRTAA